MCTCVRSDNDRDLLAGSQTVPCMGACTGWLTLPDLAVLLHMCVSRVFFVCEESGLLLIAAGRVGPRGVRTTQKTCGSTTLCV